MTVEAQPKDVEIWEDGIVITTVEDAETGNKTVYVDQPDGTQIVLDIPKEGEITAQITLGDNAEEAVATIPLDDMDGGTVAVIVGADGTEEIIKYSIAVDGVMYIMVDEDVNIKIISGSINFVDQNDAAWAKDAIAFVSARGLFLGTSDTEFAPNLAMNRAMLATVLYRLEDGYAVGNNPFVDVKSNEYYTEAVIWAAENGIVKGTGGDYFSPDKSITREELATMLYRYAGEPDTNGNLSSFPDADEISDWAEDAMKWAAEQKIITGKDNNLAEPGSTATRAEVATMLQRYVRAIIA